MRFQYIVSLIIFTVIFSTTASSQNSKWKRKQKKKELTEKQRYEEADLFAKGIIEKQIGNYKEALELFEQALEINPIDAAANYEKSRVLLAVGRNDEALIEAKNALDNSPDNIWYKAHFAKVSRINEKYDDYVRAYAELAAENPYDLNFIYE